MGAAKRTALQAISLMVLLEKPSVKLAISILGKKKNV
jgi:hypothetical protein